MKKSLTQVLAVIRAIIIYCTSPEWSPIVNSVQNFGLAIGKLKVKEKAISDLVKQKSVDIKGFTDQRRTLRTALATVSFTYLRRGMAYAYNVGNTGLYQTLNYSLSDLKGMEFTNIGQTMQQCYDALIVIPIETLTPYGITSFTKWQDMINTYNDFCGTPRSKVAGKKAIGERLEALISETNNYMRTEITPQAEAFIETQPLFVLGYKANLKKIPLSVKHNRLDAVVANEIGQPFGNCKVTIDAFEKEGRTYKAVSAISDMEGNCTVQKFESGMRTVTVSGAAIQTQTFGPFQFENKNPLNKVFVCTPAFNNLPQSKEQTPKQKAAN